MLPPGCRVDSVPRTMLAWFKAMAKERFGHAMAYEPSQGEHHAPGLHLVIGVVLPVAHHDRVGSVHDLQHLSAELHPVTQRDADGLGQG